MTVVIGESPYYWSECTRLPVALIIIHIFEMEKAPHTVSVRVDIIEFPYECQREKLFDGKPRGRS